MKMILREIRPAIMVTLVFALVTCVLYPLFVTATAQVFFKEEANGSLIYNKAGTLVGSQLLGQSSTEARYFHPRPSAAGNGYDGTNSGGSNLGPTSQKLHDLILERIVAYREENGLGEEVSVPSDAVTSSASGLDPHISVKNAELQLARVAKVRQLTAEKVHELIKSNTDRPGLGFLGEAGVNVLKLNLALDGQL